MRLVVGFMLSFVHTECNNGEHYIHDSGASEGVTGTVIKEIWEYLIDSSIPSFVQLTL